jgi:hypothetical protein
MKPDSLEITTFNVLKQTIIKIALCKNPKIGKIRTAEKSMSILGLYKKGCFTNKHSL